MISCFRLLAVRGGGYGGWFAPGTRNSGRAGLFQRTEANRYSLGAGQRRCCVSQPGSQRLLRHPPFLSGARPLTDYGKVAADAVTLLLATQNPENVGAILRTAEALGVRNVVLLAECANPYLPKTLRAAGPAPWRLNLYAGPALRDLKKGTVPLAALDVQGRPLEDFARTAPPGLGLIVGMEGPGTRELSGEIPRVTIPLTPEVDSLNASVAAGIALYALKSARE